MRARYSEWDGSQEGFEFDAATLIDQLSDELLYHGDVNAALRKLLRDGMTDKEGRRIQGLRELLESIREQRQQRLEQHDLGGVYKEVADALNNVIEKERAALDELASLADLDPDERSGELTKAGTAERSAALDLLPDDLAGRVRSLQSYDFVSDAARAEFAELLEKLRSELAQQYFDQMSEALTASPEDLARTKDMLADLNRMLAQREAGDDTDAAFAEFMEKWSDFFPEKPQSLDELLEAMARRMAAVQAMLDSMSPEQRDQLRQLSQELLGDVGLQWELDQLSSALRSAFPDAGWGQRFQFRGSDPLGLSDGADVFAQLGQLDQLESLLRSVTNPNSLAEVDLEQVKRLLGDEAAQSLEQLSTLARQLEEAGLIRNTEQGAELTPRGHRLLGQRALADLFAELLKDRNGGHELRRSGLGHDRAVETKPYEFGDPFNLNLGRTLGNAVRRGGMGTPVRLSADDFEIEPTEHLSRTATVLLLDLSLSMVIRETFLPAKKVATALHSLISGQFPRDYLGVVGFSELAYEIQPKDLPAVSWDYVYGTNMHHAFGLARKMLARERGTKQILMITDGEPTAHVLPSGEPYFQYPPARETVELTMAEVMRCTKDGIRINTFMLDPSPALRHFVESMTRLNRGRAFFTTGENLGSYVLVDFLTHRRSSSRRHAS